MTGFAMLATTAAVLRAELVALLIPVTVQHLISGYPLKQLVLAAGITLFVLGE